VEFLLTANRWIFMVMNIGKFSPHSTRPIRNVNMFSFKRTEGNMKICYVAGVSPATARTFID